MKSQVTQILLGFGFLFGVVSMSLWSWVLIDLNLTLFSHPFWALLRTFFIQIGYFDRPLSTNWFVISILWLTLFSFLMIKYYKGQVMPIVLGVGVIAGLLSYPALSHDLFNYIFDARILTHYGRNPYLFTALDFPFDSMTRFMHWTHRTYPYGPTFLLITLIPSFFGFGKFVLTFALFKLLYVSLYLLVARGLLQIHRRVGLIFVTSPLIIVEGLINSHNDFIAVGIALIALCFINTKHIWWRGLILLVSGLIKYMSLPTLLLGLDFSQKRSYRLGKMSVSWEMIVRFVVFVGLTVFAIYASIKGEIQPWYFLNLFIVLPYFPKLFLYFMPSLTGLLLSYYPYVLGGEWGQGGNVEMKRQIIFCSLFVNVLIISGSYLYIRIWRIRSARHI